MYTFADKTIHAKPGQFTMELTYSAVGKEIPSLKDEQSVFYPIELFYPSSVLDSFREIVRQSNLCDQKYNNPYTGEEEQFPSNHNEFTARHLQLLARNERSNVSGQINFQLYGNLLSEDHITRIRCLVKGTVIVGKVTATHMKGFRIPLEAFSHPEEVIIIDQAGLQWQGDLRNTGGMFFYPSASESAQLPADYNVWQNDMYLHMYGKERPAVAGVGMDVEWGLSLDSDVRIAGTLDLDGVVLGIKTEFQQALSGVVNYSKVLPWDSKPVNFKFLKAGMGFFCAGLYDPITKYPLVGLQSDGLAKLQLARLEGILAALQEYPKGTDFGTVKRLSLPFSAEIPGGADSKLRDQYSMRLNEIRDQCERLGLIWGGAQEEDSLNPVSGYMNALTNCADPHAQIGNEGGYSSVDAAIASNIPLIHRMNPAYNHFIFCSENKPLAKSDELSIVGSSTSSRHYGQTGGSDLFAATAGSREQIKSGEKENKKKNDDDENSMCTIS